MTIRDIGIDIETKSGEDLTKVGVYKYVEDPDWEIQLFSYSVNGGDVEQIDLANGDVIPCDILSALTDKTVRKWAHNCSFERVNLSRYIGLPSGEYIDPEGWYDTMIMAAYNGLPQSLEDAGKALKIDATKMKEGKALIKLFAMPKVDYSGGRRWTRPFDAPEKWKTYKAYNIRDVEAEEEIKKRLNKYTPPQSVWEEYWENERINDRGIRIDITLIKNAIRIDERCFESLMEEMKEITGLSNPNSPAQLKEWLGTRGIEVTTLGKDTVKELLEKDGIMPDVKKLLKLRLMAAKSSVKKYAAMEGAVCSDGRIRGMFRFYGAGRTGRYASKIINFQNLPRNSMSDLDEARELVKKGDFEALSMLYEDIPDVLSQLIRTALIPDEGNIFAVADYSAVEARVLAYLAGEEWVIRAFENGEDIYCTTASRMYHVPVEKHGQNSNLRAKGKQAVLACIAEGSLVLTDQGLIPIEQVTNRMKLWDGKEWVTHDGVIYKGEREVINYDGLTATPDHFVYVEGQSEPIYFGLAAASGAHLIQTGDGRRTIRLGEDNQSGKEMGQELAPPLCTYTVPGMWEHTVDVAKQFGERLIKRVPELYPNKTDSEMARSAAFASKAEMREPEGFTIQELRCERYKVRLSECNGSRTLFNSGVWPPRPEAGDRSDRQQRELCPWKSQVCNKEREYWQSEKYDPKPLRSEILALCGKCSGEEAVRGTHARSDNSGCRNCSIREAQELARNKRTARVYDIRNAGRHHRFTVSGKLVHNCGYGGSVGAISAMDKTHSIPDEEKQKIVEMYRSANPHIVKFWQDIEKAAMKAIREHTTTKVRGIRISVTNGMLFMFLPSGRRLSYPSPRIGKNRFGSEAITFLSGKTWMRIETFGGSLVENLTQAVARDLLTNSLHLLSHYRVVGHVHDEVIVEVPKTYADKALGEIEALMATAPAWAKGLPLAADGYLCGSYRKQ